MGEAVMVIDFGTSTSSAALVTGDRVRLVKEPGSGLWSWPSAVCRDGDRLLVGTTAERRKRTDPAGYRAEFKRDLGQQAPIPLGDRDYRVEELVAALLTALREQAGEPVRRALLTVPASYRPGDPRRALMIAAGEAAGFDDVELLAEPVAAALGPLSGDGFGIGDTVLVYDFGGGTFDAALVRFTGAGREVLGHAALDDCGGRDIDALLIEHVRDSGGDSLAEALAVPADAPRAVRMRLGLQFADFARVIKHQLSEVDEVEDFVSHLAPPSRVDRSELTALVAPVLARTLDCCHRLLRECGVVPAQLAAVLLVGGTSRMPVVADTVARELGRPIRRPEDPDLAVVQGAAADAGQGGTRVLRAMLATPGRDRLRWKGPAVSRLARVLTGAGEGYAAGESLAVVRDGDDRLWTLTAPPVAGTIREWTVPVGAHLPPLDWSVDVTSAGPRLRFKVPAFARIFNIEPETGRRVAFSPDGRHLVAAAVSWARVWDWESGDTVWDLQRNFQGNMYWSVAVGPDGRQVAVAGGPGVIVCDARTGEQLYALDHPDVINDVAFSPDGRWLAGVAKDGVAVLWEAATGVRARTFPHELTLYAVEFSADGNQLITSALEHTHVWDLATGNKEYLVDRAGWFALSPEASHIALANSSSLTIVTADGEAQEVASVKAKDPYSPTETSWVRPAFSPDGRLVAAGKGSDVRIYDARSRGTLRELGTIRTKTTVTSVAFSPDGRFLAAACDNWIRVYEVAEPVDEPE
ncbi:WD40 repeat protein/actin-like ATPase involved in cell morphogenesis [Actinoplanes tereljensis]|uniref:Hsp70 family protein n=1 Tax=Paractinoplanes tereljensis TaxID=571912 RepID=UPI001945326A|nr:Hsp70 family protein [Actinoplanes tereljensis]